MLYRADDLHSNQEAINRLRNYVPPPTAYKEVPLTRRAAVLLLLYADRNGELRVVITIRAKTLSSCMCCPFVSPDFLAVWTSPVFRASLLVLHDMRTVLTLAFDLL